MAQLTLTQVNTVVPGGFQTVSTCISTDSSVPPQVFVFDYQTNKFWHTATLFDLLNFPTTPTPNQAYYIQSTVTQFFNNLLDAQNNITAIQQRVASLVTAFAGSESAFIGTVVNTFTG
jgi:hypothetical protein